MPVNYFPNATEAELVKLLESLQRRATVGEIYMVTYSGDQQMRSFQGGTKVTTAIKQVLYALHLLDPDRWANPHASRQRRTPVSYT